MGFRRRAMATFATSIPPSLSLHPIQQKNNEVGGLQISHAKQAKSTSGLTSKQEEASRELEAGFGLLIEFGRHKQSECGGSEGLSGRGKIGRRV
ncbi:hypothetical protein M5K25_021417 [Dendrobium thyrsiflorum]|uniref:Uncharacterized protein n=1 Tax=Dendrobium thyrsiflorum TaxID=117978 RepID=A0ABD0UCL0_DENTH